jgi:hypothetical protein
VFRHATAVFVILMDMRFLDESDRLCQLDELYSLSSVSSISDMNVSASFLNESAPSKINIQIM